MSASTKRLRAAVCKRAEGSCEHCGSWVGLDGEEAHLDHAFGRAKVPEAVSNCWLLCIEDDSHKTLNQPSAAYWLIAFAAHCEKYGFAAEQERALAKLQALQVKHLAGAA